MTSMTGRWVDEPEAVERLAPDWAGLFDRADAPHPFLHPEWYLNWWNAFGQPEWRPRLLEVRDRDGKLRAVAPFYIQSERRWGRVASVLHLWSNAYSHRAGVLVDARALRGAADAIATALASDDEWDVALFEPLPLEHPASVALLDALEGARFRLGIQDSFASPFVVLPDTPEEMDARLGRSFRRGLRSKLNRIEAQEHAVRLLRRGEGLDDAFEISADTWQHAAGTGLGSSPRVAELYRGMVSRPWLRERLRISVLDLGGRPVAFELNLEDRQVLYNLKVGYRDTDAEHSPGIVLRHHAMMAAIREGLAEFDLLGEAERYKMHWADQVRQHGTVWVFRPTAVWTAVHAAAFLAAPALREIPGLRPLVRGIRKLVRPRG